MTDKAPKLPRWQKNTYDCKVCLSKDVDKGVAEFLNTWTESRGIKPASPLLMGRADGRGTPQVLTSLTRTATPGEAKYVADQVANGTAKDQVYKEIEPSRVSCTLGVL